MLDPATAGVIVAMLMVLMFVCGVHIGVTLGLGGFVAPSIRKRPWRNLRRLGWHGRPLVTMRERASALERDLGT